MSALQRLQAIWEEAREEQRWRDEFRRRLPTLSDAVLLSTLQMNLDAINGDVLTPEMATRFRARLYVGKKELARRGLTLPGIRD